MEYILFEIIEIARNLWSLFRQIAPYWASGLIAGSLVSVYLSEKIIEKMARLASGRFWLLPLCLASILGIVSPLCMYGTVPVIAALGKKGVPQHILISFMVSSILLNPNIVIVSFALGTCIALLRLALCFFSGILAGTLVLFLFRNKASAPKELFAFDRFESAALPSEKKTKKAFFSDLWKAFRITTPYLLFGLALTALFNRYVPPHWIAALFGAKRGLGFLFATTLAIPLYACGGGTIPLIRLWMDEGMGIGDAMAFMLAGPAVKITNLSAVKMIFGPKHFLLYLAYSLLFAMLAGFVIQYIR
ncbi:MAG: permease [Treponema sp.]|nr:permease [Treponema sp.]